MSDIVMRLVKDELIVKNESRSSDVALLAYNNLTNEQAHWLNKGWSAEEIFWSRYFWIKLYANIRSNLSGDDAGLNQFIFKLLEQPEPNCDPDWNNLEKVDSLAKKEAVNWQAMDKKDGPDKSA